MKSLESATPRSGASRFFSYLLQPELGPLYALIGVSVFFAFADITFSDGYMFSPQGISLTIVQASPIAIAALGMTIVIISGGIDLSAGTAMALCATVTASCFYLGLGLVETVVITLACGALGGLMNGALISGLKLVPFIATLGTMTAFQGFGKLLAQGVAGQAKVPTPEEKVPRVIAELLSTSQPYFGFVPSLSWGVWLGLGLAVLTAVFLRFTVTSRHIFAVGSNESTARLCGINVALTKIIVYVLAGMSFAAAGIFHFINVGKEGDPNEGLGIELRVIAAVVIGGGSLSGGRGSVLGTLCGVGIMAVIKSGSTHLEISDPIEDIAIGAIVISAVALDQWRQRRLTS
jgi:ribose transport system permease protein